MQDVDTIISGHWDTPLAWSDLVEYRAFYMDLYDQTRRGIDAGLSADETIAAYTKPARFGDYSAPLQGTFSVSAIVNYIYEGR